MKRRIVIALILLKLLKIIAALSEQRLQVLGPFMRKAAELSLRNCTMDDGMVEALVEVGRDLVFEV